MINGNVPPLRPLRSFSLIAGLPAIGMRRCGGEVAVW